MVVAPPTSKSKNPHSNLEGYLSVSGSGLCESAAGTHGTSSASVPLSLSRCSLKKNNNNSLKTCFGCLNFEENEVKNKSLLWGRERLKNNPFPSFQMDLKYFSYSSKQLCFSAPFCSSCTGKPKLIFFFMICFMKRVSFDGLIFNTCAQHSLAWADGQNKPTAWVVSAQPYMEALLFDFANLTSLLSHRHSNENVAPLSLGLPLDYKFSRFSPDKPCTSGYYPRPPDSLLKRCESLL